MGAGQQCKQFVKDRCRCVNSLSLQPWTQNDILSELLHYFLHGMNAIFSFHSSNTQEQVFFFILSVFVHRLSSHSESLPKSKLMKKKRPKACWHLVTGSLSSPGTAFDSQFVRNMSDDLSFCARWLNKLDITSCEENTRKFDVEMIFQWEDFSSSICLYSTLEHKKNAKKYIPWGLVFHVWVLTHTNNTHTHLEVEAMPHRHVLFYPHLSAHWDSHSQPFLTPHTILSTNYPVINHTQRNASLAGCDVFTWTPTECCMLLNTNISVTSPAKEINSSIEGVMTHCLDEKDPRRRVPGI